jgi:hypothetical protein
LSFELKSGELTLCLSPLFCGSEGKRPIQEGFTDRRFAKVSLKLGKYYGLPYLSSGPYCLERLPCGQTYKHKPQTATWPFFSSESMYCSHFRASKRASWGHDYPLIKKPSSQRLLNETECGNIEKHFDFIISLKYSIIIILQSSQKVNPFSLKNSVPGIKIFYKPSRRSLHERIRTTIRAGAAWFGHAPD